MKYLIILIFIVMFVMLPEFKVFVFHPLTSVKYVLKDLWNYFYHKQYNYYEGGKLDCYFAHFGGGKTLSIVGYVRFLFKRYNNKKVWDRGRKKFVLQKVHVLSNVAFTDIPFEELLNLSQIVDCATFNKEIDELNDTRTVVLAVIDEASSQLNSRNWEKNFSWDFLNTLITSRHFALSLFYSSQKFKLTDSIMRAVTQRAILCRKFWRFLIQYEYNADELELASDSSMLKPLCTRGYFIKDEDYNAYDTLATVKKLKKQVDEGDQRTAKEIMEMRGVMNPDNDQLAHPSKRLNKLRRRRK